jgi:steroid 5-alpha reductase family enzyme
MSEAQQSAHLLTVAVISVLMVVTWLSSLCRKDAGVIDICWGIGFALIAWAIFLNAGEPHEDSWLLAILTTVWAVRLSIHLAVRNLGESEDFRYRAMRERWGKSFPLASLFIVFGLQGAVMWVVSLPIQISLSVTAPTSTTFVVVGVALWAVGMFFETVGDWQLVQFKNNPDNTGQVLDTGLWRYTRHPNYFGDSLVWWGLFLVAVSQSGAWWTIISPATMTILLLQVSGVSLLERTLRSSKPEYADYVKRTNAFLPGMPRRRS